MPRQRKGPRLALRKERSGDKFWVIRDGTNYVRTGCAQADAQGAERKLEEYLASKHKTTESTDPKAIPVADILTYYARHHIPALANPRKEADFITPLIPFWGGLMLYDVDAGTCRGYTETRLEAGVKEATARRELETLRAAVNYFIKARKVSFQPDVELPQKGEPRLRWLTRSEAAHFIHAARRRGNDHIARVILIGIYTGTRVGAIKRMRWIPSLDAGYFDLDHGVMYRKGQAERSTNKRRPTIRIPARLLPHLRRWKKLDAGCPNVIHYYGIPVESIRKAWANSRADADLGGDVIPHTLRHTAASWGIQNVETTQGLQALANFLGMSLKMLLETYGHLNPVHQAEAEEAISKRPGARF